MTTDTIELRLAGGAQGFNWLPVFVAEAKGLFEREGIKVTYLKMGSVEKATLAVLDGEADLAITPPEGAVADFAKGGDLVIVAANSVRLPMSLVANPAITSLAQLKGARIGTSSLREGTAIYTQIMLAEAGLRYPGDYEFVLAGVHTTRWEALRKGEIDAAPQPAPWNFIAENEGYNLLAEVSDAIPEILFAALIGKRGWAQEHKETLGRFLRALDEASALVNDPAHEDEVLPSFGKVTTPDDTELARRGFRHMRDLGMWPARLAISEKALATTIDLMIRAGLLEEEHRITAAGVFDRALLDEALSHGAGN